MNKIRLITLFSGYDSQALSMERLKRDYPDKFDYELVAWCEIDKAACMAHDAIFPQWKDRNLGDISKVKAEDIPDCDCMTWSFPCTDISGAGKQMGLSKDSGTRSSLCWEAIRCFKEKKPKFLLMENVSALAQRRFIRDFHALQYELEQIGYTNFCAILDSSKYGVPQHRERLFMISILDCTKSYHFPEPFKLEKRIKDILEPYGTVDESFYFSPEQLLRIIAHCDRKVDEGCGFKTQFHTEDEISGCVTTRYGQRETDPCIKESVLFNPMDDGTARTIKAQYAKNGVANFLREDGFGASGVQEPARIKEGISIHPLNRKMEFQGFKSIKSDTEPCLTSHDGRGGEPCLWEKTDKIIKLGNYTPRGTHAGTLVSVEGIAPTVMGQHGTVTGVVEPCILTPQRTEEAKELRRKGIEVFGHRELVPREDGVSNTITTVQKDNMLVEPAIIQRPHGWNPGRLVEDVCPTITISAWEANNLLREPVDRKSKIRSKVMPNGNIRFYQDDESKSGISEMQIIHPDNECPTITTAHVPKILEPVTVAMRGRNPDNPSDRSKGCPTEQRLECGDNIANCITTVQKDSMVAEPMVSDDPRKVFGEFRYSDVCSTLLGSDYKSPKLVREPIGLSLGNLPDKTVLKDEDDRGYLWQDGSLWRVRKLTPIEVFRLQDVSDEDAKKIIAVCSKTACYQLAGNSITCAVLYHIFRKLWIDTECESAQKSLFDF